MKEVTKQEVLDIIKPFGSIKLGLCYLEDLASQLVKATDRETRTDEREKNDKALQKTAFYKNIGNDTWVTKSKEEIINDFRKELKIKGDVND